MRFINPYLFEHIQCHFYDRNTGFACLGKPVPEVGEGAGIIHQNDFLHQLRWGPVQY
jgi:hypothetical protein